MYEVDARECDEREERKRDERDVTSGRTEGEMALTVYQSLSGIEQRPPPPQCDEE